MSGSTALGPHQVAASLKRGPVLWLIVSGALLVAAITIGTAVVIGQFRERAISNSKRELENTVLLLTRHFDQQFEDSDVIAADLIAKMQLGRSASPEIFRKQMSTWDAHLMLKSKSGALSYTGDVNIFDSDGKMINSSGIWPTPAISIADQDYYNAFKSDPQSKVTVAEPVRSYFSGNQTTTVAAHRLSGPGGIFLGVMERRIDSANFENFFASVALGEGAAISMFHRDGTMLARYPHADSTIGQNFKTAPLLQRVETEGGLQTLSVESPIDRQERLGAAAKLSRFPIIIVATTTVSSVLADWRAQTRFMVAGAVLAALVIAFILYLIVRQMNRQNRESQQRKGSSLTLP
jgi:histidine kinase family protein